MKQHILLLGILIIIFIGSLNGCFGPVTTENFNKEYPVKDQTTITVSNINGKIDIAGWNESLVSLNAVKKSSLGQEELNKVNISVVMAKYRIDIKVKYIGIGSMQSSVDMTIKIPFTMMLNSATTTNGEIQISGIKGNSTLSSSNGAILVENVDGYVQASTSNGLIEIRGTTGIGDVHTSNGAISVEVRDFRNSMNITTSNGAITAYINPLLNATLDMTTSNGKITVHDLTLDYALTEETHIIGILGIDGRRVDIRTSNGNIDLYKLSV
jgi:DUF4097 and DUF4098 domain-containing protein YvlB